MLQNLGTSPKGDVSELFIILLIWGQMTTLVADRQHSHSLGSASRMFPHEDY